MSSTYPIDRYQSMPHMSVPTTVAYLDNTPLHHFQYRDSAIVAGIDLDLNTLPFTPDMSYNMPPLPTWPRPQTAISWLDSFQPPDLPVAPSGAVMSAQGLLQADWTTINSVRADPQPARATQAVHQAPANARNAANHQAPVQNQIRTTNFVCQLHRSPRYFNRQYELTRHLYVHGQAEQHYHCTSERCGYGTPRPDKAIGHVREVHPGKEGDDLLETVTDQDLVAQRGCLFPRCKWYRLRQPYLALRG
ncbi:hypothetical protein LTR22_025432 [Elasticomyces elasticus]|nr:hypothetical protein LTR22_025432 [Elasticomyces elasticus]KAK4908043.1 hypothetical protein LTR49_022998 [Elasticomyces elasticus]KAK5740473.1 hypothetical protein LTS12_024933 [Elasticomyces elasticus]